MIDRDRRPSVAVVAHALDREGQGMERLHAEVITRLSNDFAFTVYADHVDTSTLGHCAFVKVPVVARPIPVRFAQFYARASMALRRAQGSYDLIHSVGAIVAGRVDLVTIHLLQAGVIEANGGLAPAGAPPIRRLNTAALKTMALLAERRMLRGEGSPTVAAVSRRGAAEIASAYPKVKVQLTENAIAMGRFDSPDPAVPMAVRSELAVSPATFVVLAVGGDWHLRGVPLLLEALAQVNGDVVLWIAGRGDEASMQAKAASLGISSRVRFLGVRHDLEILYRAADLLVQASAYETFSLVLLEAARSMLPLVTTDVGIARELCGDNDGGLIVGRRSSDIAAAMREVIENRTRASARAVLARERTERFTYDALCASTAEVYRELLGQRR